MNVKLIKDEKKDHMQNPRGLQNLMMRAFLNHCVNTLTSIYNNSISIKLKIFKPPFFILGKTISSLVLTNIY